MVFGFNVFVTEDIVRVGPKTTKNSKQISVIWPILSLNQNKIPNQVFFLEINFGKIGTNKNF